jgi:hypothetical protein
LPDAEVLLRILKPLTKAVIDRAPALRLIQKIGVGVNTIDLEAARARGIAVANMPGTNTKAAAETAPMLMLAALRNPGRAFCLGGRRRPRGRERSRRRRAHRYPSDQGWRALYFGSLEPSPASTTPGGWAKAVLSIRMQNSRCQQQRTERRYQCYRESRRRSVGALAE